MALNKIWNLRADPAWIELVKIQAIEAGRDNPGFKGRMLMLGRELDDQNLFNLFRFQALYGPYATDKRVFSRLAPVHCPEFLRYGTQEQLEANLQDELNRNGVA